MRTNYVIAAWTGQRANEDLRHVADRTFFIQEQLAAIARCASSDLTMVTIVLAGPGNTIADAWIKSLVEIRGIPIRVIERDNYGISYASWNLAFEQLSNDFDLWILTEDDYIPCVLNFDRELAKLAEVADGYVCGLANSLLDHAAVSTAVMPSKTWRNLHPLPSHTMMFNAQILWSKAIADRGTPVIDWSKQFATPFWVGTEVRWYGHPGLQPMFLPVQVLRQSINITNGQVRIPCVISEFGDVTPLTEEALQEWRSWLTYPINSPHWRTVS